MAAVALGALAVTAEYDSMMIRSTLAADPRRLSVLLAKTAVVVFVVLVAGLVSVAGSLAASRLVVPDTGRAMPNGYPPVSLADEPTLRAYVGTVLYLGLIALLSLGVAAAVRHTAGAVSTVLALLYVAPILAQLITDPTWHMRVQKYAPMTAGLAIQATRRLELLPIAPWQGLGVLAIYAGVAVVVGAVVFVRRDA
jgi:ABC-2 type transport system permease protein